MMIFFTAGKRQDSHCPATKEILFKNRKQELKKRSKGKRREKLPQDIQIITYSKEDSYFFCHISCKIIIETP